MTSSNTSKFKSARRKRYFYEFLFIFIAVISAFALNNWNENRRDANAQTKILKEIKSGLSKDLLDLKVNKDGHLAGIRASKIFNQILIKGQYNGDSLHEHFNNLTRDFISIQNLAGYFTLKANGLELISYDRLRREIIALYEYYYNSLKKFEEEYEEMQFHKNYFPTLNDILTPHFIFGNSGRIVGLRQPLDLTEAEENKLRLILHKIFANRMTLVQFYKQTEIKARHVRTIIEIEFGE